MTKARKERFVSPESKTDFIGHIVFPYSEEVRNLFFQKAKHPPKYAMYWEGEFIDNVGYTGQFLNLLKEAGYQFSTIEQAGTHNVPRSRFDNIPVYANVEYENNSKTGSPCEIVISYHAKDIIETGARGKHILNKVRDLTGIEGHGTVYGKNTGC